MLLAALLVGVRSNSSHSSEILAANSKSIFKEPQLGNALGLETKESFNILVWPAEWSHWINMNIILSKLYERGHNITVIRPGLYTDFIKPSEKYTIIDLETPEFPPSFHLDHLQTILRLFKLGDKPSPIYEKVPGMIKFWHTHIHQRWRTVEILLQNSNMLNLLLESDFDVVMADPCVMGGEMLAAYLGDLPLVHNVRILPAEMQQQLAGAPFPASYVPVINTVLTDRMSFLQRTWNFLNIVGQTVATRALSSLFMDSMVKEYILDNPRLRSRPVGTGVLDLQKEAAIWLVRLDFTFEFPRPLMPNMKYIGGFHCSPANLENIDDSLTSFIESAPKGVVVLSMGSMVDQMGTKKAEIIAEALANIETGYKVIWRYNGAVPTKLGPNTRLESWLPQNDLLGHPNVKLFITHGGTNGVYQAVYHGTPILGIPLLVDQFDNILRIERWNAGSHFDITRLVKQQDSYMLTAKIDAILNDSDIKAGIQYLSDTHRLRPIEPVDEAAFWVEYAVKTRGAKHLKSQANNLYWFQYHLLDVILFLVGIVFVLYKLIRLLCRRRVRKTKID